MSLKLFFVIFSVAILPACGTKEYEHCVENRKITISVTDNLTVDGSISFSANGINNAKKYLWHGPNKFYSTEQYPRIDNPGIASAGRYTVDVFTEDGCIYSATTDSIAVTPPQAPCSVPDNYAEFSTITDSYYNIVYFRASSYTYEINAYVNFGYGELFMQFAGSQRPIPGVYTIGGNSQYVPPGQVRVEIANKGRWYGYTGKVYVTQVGRRLVVTCCNADFGESGNRTKVSFRIVEP